MRKSIIIALFIVGSLNVLAQDPNYNGPAKVYVNTFWKNVETLKSGKGGSVSNLERAINTIKEKDPAYNTSSMEAEIKVWKEKAGEQAAGKQVEKDQQAKKMEEQNKAQWNDIYIKKDLEYLFKEANLQVGHNNLEFAQKRLDDFKAKTENVLSKTKTPTQDYVKYISKFNGTMPQFYERNKALLDDINNVEEYKPAFLELQLYEAYWDAAQRIYPGQSEFKEAYNKIVAYKKSVGSLDDVKKVSDGNSIEKVKSRKMESPVVKDASLEKFVSDAFNTRFAKVYGTALKVILTQGDWTIERNKLTSVIVGRYRSTQLAYKGNNGKCYLLSGILYVHEEYAGNSYVNRTLIYDGLGGQEMLCENVK